MNKTKLRALLISSDTTLKESMQRLNETAEKILFVVDENDKLLGTVTDGDIRRGLINGIKFSDKIEEILFKEFTSIFYDEPNKKDKAQKIMLSEKIEQIPILDNDDRIIDAVLWSDIFGKNFLLVITFITVDHIVHTFGGFGRLTRPGCRST